MGSDAMITRDMFGTDEVYYVAGENGPEIVRNLSEKVSTEGHSGFDPAGISSYLTFRYPIGNKTMFRDYKSVPAGSSLVDGVPRYHWHPEFSTSEVPFEEALENIGDLLTESIMLLTNGKTVGITIGGVDSSLLCALTKELYPDKELYTYSVGFDGADEFEYAKVVAEHCGTIHKELFLKRDDYIGPHSMLRPMIRKKGAPLHPNELALAYAQKVAVEDGCEVVLSGEGGDDICGGYGQLLRMYMNYDGLIPYERFLLDNYRYFSLDDRVSLINANYLVDDVKLLEPIFQEDDVPMDIRDKMFYFIQRVHTVGLITRGSNAMRFNNLPIAFPYIYSKLVDFVNALPFDYKIHWKSERHESEAENMYFRDISENKDITKYILKRLAAAYLPDRIVHREKYGFPVPFENMLKDVSDWPLNKNIFRTTDIGNLNGWKKFMVINLNAFVEEFEQYKRR